MLQNSRFLVAALLGMTRAWQRLEILKRPSSAVRLKHRKGLSEFLSFRPVRRREALRTREGSAFLDVEKQQIPRRCAPRNDKGWAAIGNTQTTDLCRSSQESQALSESCHSDPFAVAKRRARGREVLFWDIQRQQIPRRFAPRNDKGLQVIGTRSDAQGDGRRGENSLPSRW